MSQFKVGGEVILYRLYKGCCRNYPDSIGCRGIVQRIDLNGNLEAGREVLHVMWVGRRPDGKSITSWYSCNFKKVQSEVDLSRTVVTRGKLTVIDVSANESERPILATIVVDGQPLTLSYDKFGQFIEDQQCPVDLVNR